MSVLDTFNLAARAVRDAKFDLAKMLDWNNSPVVVSEGDSS